MPTLAPGRDRAESCNHALAGNGETPPKDGISYPSADPRQFIDLTSTVHCAIRQVISSPEPGRTLVAGVPRQNYLIHGTFGTASYPLAPMSRRPM